MSKLSQFILLAAIIYVIYLCMQKPKKKPFGEDQEDPPIPPPLPPRFPPVEPEEKPQEKLEKPEKPPEIEAHTPSC